MDATVAKRSETVGGAGYVESDRKLRKDLSFWRLLMLSLGAIIGSGWLFAVASPFGIGVAGPAVIISWIIGGVLVLLVALTYAEVAGMLPRTGAIVRYPNLTHGGFTGSIIGWAYLLSAVTVPAIEAIAVATYMAVYVPSLCCVTATTALGTATLLNSSGVVVAFLLMVGFFFLNFFGIKLLGRVNQAVTWWKFVIPVITFLFLFGVFHASNFSFSFSATSATGVTGSGFLPFGWPGVFEAIALAGIIFSYLGFRQALDYGGEAKNPQRDIPLATILSVVIGIVVYTLLQITFIGAINWGAAGVTPGDWYGLATSTWGATPFYSALSSAPIALLGAFASLLLVDAIISPSGTGWIYMGTSGRTFYGLGANGLLGRGMLRMNRWGIPWIALIASLVVGTLFLLPFPSWYLMVGFITLATTFTYIMGGVGLQSFRRHAPSLHRPFKLPFGTVVAGMAFIAAMMIVYWGTFSVVAILEIAVFAGMVIFILFYAPARMGVHEDLAYLVGIVFLALLVALAGLWYYSLYLPALAQSSIYTGVANAGLSNVFIEFAVGLGALAFGTTLVLYLAVPREHKREMASGVWLISFMITILVISFYGTYGYDTVGLLSFPWDFVAMIMAGIVLYVFAIYSSYRTPELQEIIDARAPEVVQTDEGPGPLAGGGGTAPTMPTPARAER